MATLTGNALISYVLIFCCFVSCDIFDEGNLEISPKPMNFFLFYLVPLSGPSYLPPPAVGQHQQQQFVHHPLSGRRTDGVCPARPTARLIADSVRRPTDRPTGRPTHAPHALVSHTRARPIQFSSVPSGGGESAEKRRPFVRFVSSNHASDARPATWTRRATSYKYAGKTARNNF